MKSPKIIDTTLREGNQAPYVFWELKEVRNIAAALVNYGVDCIEVGHPYSSTHELQKVKTVCEVAGDIPVLAHARALQCDIDAVKESGAGWIGIFMGINPLALEYKYNNLSIEDALKRIADAVIYAKSLGLQVRFTLEDSSRTEQDLQLAAFEAALLAGADRLCFSDTVGRLNTHEIVGAISFLRTHFQDAQIEIHLHNDRGLALANSLAVAHLVDWISCSINGIGERCGITDTIQLKSNLSYEETLDIPHAHMEAARDVSTMVNAYSRSNYSERAPIVGVNAFTHSADLHIKAFARNLNAYCWLPNYPDQKVQISERIALETYVNHSPKVISSTELKYHGKGPGSRYLMLDERVAPNVKQYCIVREIDEYCEDYPSYVDEHTHNCDSLFLFLGDEPAKKGLQVMVRMEDAEFILDSPASVFIPAGKQHTYKVLKGKGSFVNHVLHQNYNLSLLEPEEVKASSMHSVTNS